MPHPEPSPPAASPCRFRWRQMLQIDLQTLIVAVVCLLLACVAVPWVLSNQRLNKEIRLQRVLPELAAGMVKYAREHGGKLPPLENAAAVAQAIQPYVDNHRLQSPILADCRDEWGYPLKFMQSKRLLTIRSVGPNGVDDGGGGDDYDMVWHERFVEQEKE